MCEKEFELRFGYQVSRTPEGTLFFCSQSCHERHLFSAEQKKCSNCNKHFQLQFAYQQMQVDGEVHYLCSQTCRTMEMEVIQSRQQNVHHIAVLNQKGGTGKTTTSVNLAAGLANLGHRVLLIDLDAQGNVAVSLGLQVQKTLYNVLVDDEHPIDCIINASKNLDVLASNTRLAQAEFKLVNTRNRHRVLSDKMSTVTNYDFVVMDCGPSLSLLNQNALVYSNYLLIPVSCDYLSLVGVRQILRTMKQVNQMLLRPIEVLGVVPTFFDRRTRVSLEAVTTLNSYFKERVMSPIRINTVIKEAPSHKKTIFEHAPDSRGAEDYRRLVKEVIERCELRRSEKSA